MGGHVTLLHLTQAKFHDPPPRTATSVVHAGSLKREAAGQANPAGWRWHVGDAMLPIPMRLHPSAKGAAWEAENASIVNAFYARAKRRGAVLSVHCGGGDDDGGGGAAGSMDAKGAAIPCASIPADEALQRPASDEGDAPPSRGTPQLHLQHLRLVRL